MDYEKKYNDALKRAKAVMDVAANQDEARGIATTIFPELRESEDERIRKELLAVINDLVLPDEQKVRFNAYLEKQKEQKPVEPSDDELQRHQDELYNFKVFAAKQAKEHRISFVHDFEWNNFCAELLSYFNEKQKPAENGTRTKIISRAANEKQVVLLSESDGNAEIGWDTRSLEDTKKLLEYGIAFINKQLGTKPTEWSEEDKKIMKTLLDYYEKALDNYSCVEWLNGITYGELCDWLKSLRPQPHWKPSEEQMHALEHFIKSWGESGTMNPQNTILRAAKSLLIDLQKLLQP